MCGERVIHDAQRDMLVRNFASSSVKDIHLRPSIVHPVAAALLGMVVIAGCHSLQTPVVAAAPVRTGAAAPAVAAASRPGTDSIRNAGSDSRIRPYTAVVTKGAITRSGFFTTHVIGDRLLFEIPRSAMNVDMLQLGRFARAPASAPTGDSEYGGDQFSERTLRWDRIGNRVYLRSPSYSIMADSTLPIYRAIQGSDYPPIIAAFDVLTYGPDSAVVIDVTKLFTTSVPEFAALHGQIDPQRSFIERVTAFPGNVEVEATQTVTPNASQLMSLVRTAVPTQSVLAHWSMIRLPEHPMMPRLADDRIGFYSRTRVDFGTNEYHAVDQRYIGRWRLEKKFPDSAVSVPLHQIVYYIDPATPDKWKPWIKKGVEAWQPAFEAAGFRDAIVARDPPKNDPDWSAEDIRHTVIRWMPSITENAASDGTRDIRTGEVLNGSVRVYNNIMNLARDWYLTQVAPLDPRVQRGQFPDSLMGRLLQYIVSHEVGHTIGLYHNHKASSLYPTDSLRSHTWLAKMGHTPSLMDYSRLNYVAQPEDSIPLADLVPRVGPADIYTVKWGYTPIPGAKTPDEERPTLDRWARMQDSIPWLRFGHSTEVSTTANVDPGDETEAVGDADAVKATGYGLRNIRRTVPMLLAMTTRPTEDNSELRELYVRLVNQWRIELTHVANVVGGSNVQTKYGSQPGPVYSPVSRERQVAAVKFLNQNAFQTPTFLFDESITRRLEPVGTMRRISSVQTRLLSTLLQNARLARLREYAAMDPQTSYSLDDMLGDVRHGVWSELSGTPVSISVERRALQMSYIADLATKINPPPGSAPKSGSAAALTDLPNEPDVQSILRGELIDLGHDIDRAIPRAANRDTRLHLLDAKARIGRILEPK